MADILKIQTDLRTSAKRYFLNGKRISRRDAAKLMNEPLIVVIYGN